MSIPLESFFGSKIAFDPSQGMDLKQGVPQKAGIKDDSSFDKIIDQKMMADEGEIDSQKSLEEDSQDVVPENVSEDAEPLRPEDKEVELEVETTEVIHQPEPLQAQLMIAPVVQNPLRLEDDSELIALKSSDSLPNSQDKVPLQIPATDLNEVIPQEEESQSSIELPLELPVNLAPQANEMGSADVARPIDSEKPSLEKAQDPIDALNPTDSETSPIAVANSAESSADFSEFKDDDQEGLAKQVPVEAAPRSLKEFSEGLWIQQNLLKSEKPMEVQDVGSLSLGTEPAGSLRSQVVKEMQPIITKMVSSQEGGEIVMSLRPANLGQMKVRIEVMEQAVKVNFLTETSAAQQLLQSQSAELRQQLNSSGMRVEQMSFGSLHNASLATAQPQSRQHEAFNQSQQQPQQQNQQNREHREFQNQSQGRDPQRPAKDFGWNLEGAV